MALRDVRDDVLFGQRARLEVLLHQRVVRLGDDLDQALALLVDHVAPLGGDGDLFGLARRVELVSLHVDDVHDAAEVRLLPDGEREGDDGAAEGVARASRAPRRSRRAPCPSG